MAERRVSEEFERGRRAAAQFRAAMDSVEREVTRSTRTTAAAVGGGGRGGGGGGAIGGGGAAAGGAGGGGRDDLLQKTIRSERELAAQQARTRAEFQRTSVVVGANAQTLRAHGALTTEWIQAAARGDTTFRELGYQVGQTTAKFGGWLAAGAAVYGLLGGLNQLYQGALQADRGITNLDRVVTNLQRDSARQALLGQAEEFNLPIEDVARGAFDMGKVFHDQNQTLEANRAVLAAVKIGELEAGQAAKYLTAIVQGFKLPAEDMGTVLDQVNEAQNRYGASIPDLVAGVAKAGGAFKTAEGDVSSLIALIATAQRATGSTGETIGTALQRVPGRLQQSANQEVLRGFGVDPTQPINQVIEQAMERARGLAGKEVQQLGTAIAGTQYGPRVLVPLLQNAELYNEILRDTSPEAAKGSAQRELAATLGAVQERLAAVGVGLQQLGGNLAQAGFGSVFVGVVQVLNLALDVTNGLLGVFNELPEPLRHSVTLLAQMALIMRGLQRFRFGDVLADRGAPQGVSRLFNEPQGRYETRLARVGAREERGLLQEDLTRETKNLRRQQLLAGVVQEKEAEVQAGIRRRLEDQNVDAERRVALGDQLDASNARVGAAENSVLQSKLRQEALARELAAVEARQAQIEQRRVGIRAGHVATAQAGAASEFYVPGELDRPTSAAPLVGGFAAPLSQADRQRAAIRRLRHSQLGLVDQYRQGRIAYPDLSRSATAFAVSGTALAQGVDKARVASAAATNRARRAGTALANAGRSLYGMIGPVGLLFIGVTFAIDAALRIRREVEDHNKDLQALGRRLGRQSQTRAEENQLLRSLEKQRDRDPTVAETLREALPLGPYLGGLLPGSGADARQQERAVAERTRQQILERRRQRQQDARGGRFIGADALVEDIEASSRATVRELRAGNITRAQAIERIDNAILSAEKSLTGKARNRAITALLSRKIDLGYDGNLMELALRQGDKALQDRADAYAALAEGGDLTGRDIDALVANSLAAAIPLAGKPNLDARRKLAEINKARVEAIERNADAKLQEDLLLARGQRERQQAYNRYGRRIDRGVLGSGRERIAELRELQERDRRKLEAEIEQAAVEPGPEIRNFGFRRGQSQASQAVEGLRKGIRARRQQIRRIAAQLDIDAKEVKLIMREQEIARYEEESAFRSAQTDFGQYRLARGLPRIRYQIERIRLEINRAIEVYGRRSTEVLQLLAQEQGLIEQQVDEQLSIIRAQGELRVAGLEGQALSRGQVGNIDQQIAFLRSNKGSEAEILQLQAQRKSLLAEVQKQAEEEARAAIESIYELRIARREDPVKIARLELRRDAALRRRLSPGADVNERRRLQAQQIRSRRNLRDTIVDAELEDIRHRAALDKLTTDQQIRALQNLLKTHRVGRDARRRIREQIHQLRNEADQEGQFDLAVGNIRLPTIYEIRRSVAAGRQGSSVTVQNRNNVNVTITDPNAVPAFAAKMEQITGTAQAAFARAGGGGSI